MSPESAQSPFLDVAPASAVAAALARLASAVRQHAWQGAAEAGLTPTQGQLADLLSRRDGATLAELAVALGVGAATASEAIGAMVEKGLVERSRSADDRRRLALRLTARGERIARASAEWSAFLAAAATSLPAADQRELLALLVRLIRELQRRGEIPGARMCVTCVHFRPHRHDDARRPHHCAFVDAPFGDGAYRFDCPDHEPAEAATAAAALERFVVS
jgi:DNA-binding MarR family transcriptional regulator